MKKLALASVAFAAVSAFGAGDSFATLAFISSPSAVTWNDSAAWTSSNGAAAINGGASSATITASTSVSSTQGINVRADYTTIVSPGSTNFLTFGAQGGSVQLQFPPGSPVLFGTSAGTIKLSFSKALEGVGFFVSPAELGSGNIGSHYNVELTTYGGVGHTASHTYSGLSFNTDCMSASCTYVGAQSSTGAGYVGITSVLVSVTNSDIPIIFAPAISDLSMQDGPAMPTPEPASLSLLGAGLLGLSALRRRWRSASPDGIARSGFLGRWRGSKKPPDIQPMS